MTNTQRQILNLIFISNFLIDTTAESFIDIAVKLAEFFQKWPNFFDMLAGKQFWNLATLELGLCQKFYRQMIVPKILSADPETNPDYAVT
jgi:hypothetical protein